MKNDAVPSDKTAPPGELKLDSLSLGGDAVGRVSAGGAVVFVPYGAPEDRVALERAEAKKNFWRAWPASVLEASPHRVAPPCPHHYVPGRAPEAACGGCDWQHMNYAYQLRAKKNLLVEAFQRLARIAHPPVEDTIGVDRPDGLASDGKPGAPWRYRNKVQIPFSGEGPSLQGGFYAPGSHRIVPFDDCLVQGEDSVRIFKAVLDWFRRHPVAAYEQNNPRGWLRHLLVRSSAQGQSMVAVVTNGANFPDAVGFSKNLTALCPSVTSVFQNVNTRPDNVILGPEWRHLDGKRFLAEHLLGLKFRLSPGSFFQVHNAMAEKLYKQVERFVEPTPQESVLELYAGVGAIAQYLARRARMVWAVEEVPSAVEDAIESAKWNEIKNVRFLLSRCEAALARGRFRRGATDYLAAVVLDPPRAGCEPHVLRGVMRLEPRKIVYVSCDPATLARDARYLATGGYLLKKSVPVDLFSQTSHIESVSLFARNPGAAKTAPAAPPAA